MLILRNSLFRSTHFSQVEVDFCFSSTEFTHESVTYKNQLSLFHHVNNIVAIRVNNVDMNYLQKQFIERFQDEFKIMNQETSILAHFKWKK